MPTRINSASSPIPRPTSFWWRLVVETPAFVWDLWSSTHSLSPVTPHAPKLVPKAERLWAMLEASGVIWPEPGRAPGQSVWLGETSWHGSASDLHTLLLSEPSRLSESQRRGLGSAVWIGQALAEAARTWGAGVVHADRTAAARLWTVHRRPTS